jgi:hypothetical protein
LAKEILAALSSFPTRLCRRCLPALSNLAAQISCLIRPCSDIKASTVIGVTGVAGVDRTLFCKDVAATVAVELLCSVGGFGMLRNTLSGFKGNNLAAAYLARMFLLVIALSLAGL